MNETEQPNESNESHAWDRVKEALRRDWDQTKHDFGAKFGQDLKQNIGNTVAQATGNEPLPDRHTANAPDAWPDEVAVRYGYSSAQSPNYREQMEWNAALEKQLQEQWESMKSGRDWSDVRLAVRYGWTRARSHASA